MATKTYNFHPNSPYSTGSTAISDYAKAIDNSVGDTSTNGYRSTNTTSDTTGSIAIYYGIDTDYSDRTELINRVNSGSWKITSIQAKAKFRRYGSTSTYRTHCILRCTHDSTSTSSYTECGDGGVLNSNNSTTINTYTYNFPSAVTYFNNNPSHLSTIGLRATIAYVRLYDLSFSITLEEVEVTKYTATFKNSDGTVLETKSVDAGSTPTYTGSTPTKASTAQYSYTFSGWSPSLSAISADTVYTAQYTSTVRSYAIKFVNYDGTVLQNTNVKYGITPTYSGSTPTRESTAQYSYTFKGWDSTITSVTGAKTYTATYTATIRSYTVTYHKYDGTTTTATVNYGSTISNIPTDTRSGYAFSGWCKCEAVKVNGSMVESQEYNGSYCVPIGRTYMYSGTDKISVHVEAYRDDWSTITQHYGEQIISCTAGGGWGIGYFANTGGSGYEIKISSIGNYTGGAFPFTSLSSGWHSFDLVYNGSTVTGYYDGKNNDDAIGASGNIIYNSNNGIFVGAEAGESQTEPESPNARYWNGMISNVFISNTGELLTVNTNTEITGNLDLYPIWHYTPSVAPTFSSVSMIYNNQQISSSHKVLAGESFIVSCEVN